MLKLLYLPESTPSDHHQSPVENATGDPDLCVSTSGRQRQITEITEITSEKYISAVTMTRARCAESTSVGGAGADGEKTRARADVVIGGDIPRALVIGDPAEYTKALPLENASKTGSPVPEITGDPTGDPRQPLPQPLWRRDLTSHADAWRHYEAMCTAGYQVRLVGRADPERWDVCAPVAAAASPSALPAELARDFATFVEAWRYCSRQAGYLRALWRDEARSCYHVGAPAAATLRVDVQGEIHERA